MFMYHIGEGIWRLKTALNKYMCVSGSKDYFNCKIDFYIFENTFMMFNLYFSTSKSNALCEIHQFLVAQKSYYFCL